MYLIIKFTPKAMIPIKEMVPHYPFGIKEHVEDVHKAIYGR